MKRILLGAALAAPLHAQAADDADLRALREELHQLQQTYQKRLEELENRLQKAEQRTVEPTVAVAPAPEASASAFNPAVSLILSGTYGNLRQDPALPATGFAMSPNNPNYSQGFGIKESELAISASVDPRFSGMATLALAPAGGVTVENAYVDATALGNGLKLRFGRFFSDIGYLNPQHAHAWDFVDQPLVYRALWDNQLGDDGVQLKWLAPTDTFVELGAEFGRGRTYPGTDQQNRNGSAASAAFLHVGGDAGESGSWRVGASFHQTRQNAWQSSGVPDLVRTVGGVTNEFTGDARTAGLDFVWKYAPQGNNSLSSVKVQGEYFRRRQNGMLTYNLLTTDSYAVAQSGWYLQSVYKFLPQWRAGLRYDRLDPGIASVGALNTANVISDYGYKPSRGSVMFDYSPSEFSRLRLQYARDLSRQGLPDDQWLFQYIMSLGAHGAHSY